LQFLDYVNPLGHFAMWTAFPPSDYYRPSAPPQAIGGRRTFPADTPGGRVRGGSLLAAIQDDEVVPGWRR
jgi:hypothetical protein